MSNSNGRQLSVKTSIRTYEGGSQVRVRDAMEQFNTLKLECIKKKEDKRYEHFDPLK